MSIPKNIESEIAGLPTAVRERAAASTTIDTDDSALYQALMAAGFIGCINSNEQLATTYKSQLDFSGKCGTSQ